MKKEEKVKKIEFIIGVNVDNSPIIHTHYVNNDN